MARLLVREQVWNDLEEVGAYIAQDNPAAAGQIARQLRSSFEQLARMPQMSREVKEIKMEILAPDRTIAGDYLLTLTANAPEVNKSVEFRVTVSTPTVWGWIGFGIVALVVLGLAVVFFRLGRR